MGSLSYAVAAFLVLAPAAASAADNFISGNYLRSEEICSNAKKNSLQNVIEDGNMVLSARGFDALEYNCAFVEVSKHPRQDKAWLVTAICEEPGLMSPDVFSIVERQSGQLDVTSMRDEVSSIKGSEGGEDGLSGTFYRCDGVTLP
ncbi:hypothetical protein SAZ10_13605 [Mesorhizobium sp. BAC0120]|uniref:hypothetical protein n=1 Tax=Mesorhizobium sp. BAC0120 TaxID=3090670 RepID=UPI00298CE936|nr:hypothetical protein [Mesorhizobium sp. BAC0120]MDW6022794.1 hypothetical protein [Mesorhizobium sp. BAC0120]